MIRFFHVLYAVLSLVVSYAVLCVWEQITSIGGIFVLLVIISLINNF